MKEAIIDIGSNSLRLTLYETDGHHFKLLFREKVMAGLAGYVEDGRLSAEGIECACAGLMNFQNILRTLEIKDVWVFATASLRNISNTEQAVSVIQAATGYSVEVISEEEEALFGYTGAMQELHVASGAFFDIGGASTEVVNFDNGVPKDYVSYPIGSLNLYRRYVKKILPGASTIKKMQQSIAETISANGKKNTQKPLVVGVGGTARAVLKLARYYYGLSEDCRSMTMEQLDGLCQFLYSGKKSACDMILKLEPDRIHTIIPGTMILQHICHMFQAQHLVVGKYGVREGYLCRKVLKTK